MSSTSIEQEDPAKGAIGDEPAGRLGLLHGQASEADQQHLTDALAQGRADGRGGWRRRGRVR
jgi:hypothetical protein